MRRLYKLGAYNGVPSDEDIMYYSYYSKPKPLLPVPKKDNVYSYMPFLRYYQPEPDYALNDQIINQITEKILTQITMYKPKREIEISPNVKIKLNLG